MKTDAERAIRDAISQVGCEPFNEVHLFKLLGHKIRFEGGEAVVDYPIPLVEAIQRMEQEPHNYGGLFKARFVHWEAKC